MVTLLSELLHMLHPLLQLILQLACLVCDGVCRSACALLDRLNALGLPWKGERRIVGELERASQHALETGGRGPTS
jgi:hypothetical protein